MTSIDIRDVWESNLEEEFVRIRAIVQDYPFIAMVSSLSNITIDCYCFWLHLSAKHLILYCIRSKLKPKPSFIPLHCQDTEFPGIVVKPVGDFKMQGDYQYQTLRCNVDVLKLIQLGKSCMVQRGEMRARDKKQRWMIPTE